MVLEEGVEPSDVSFIRSHRSTLALQDFYYVYYECCILTNTFSGLGLSARRCTSRSCGFSVTVIKEEPRGFWPRGS